MKTKAKTWSEIQHEQQQNYQFSLEGSIKLFQQPKKLIFKKETPLVTK